MQGEEVSDVERDRFFHLVANFVYTSQAAYLRQKETGVHETLRGAVVYNVATICGVGLARSWWTRTQSRLHPDFVQAVDSIGT